ncbi:maleylpyruvate isomerase family mycothiol-dependent enzyme [Hamadaea sp. NPDC051192]|uniref:maleylpyruvate isomerase family mycothiol-dependent enzyme n=1 Tax=Hamadaea sp. NPDC051192 TaxID=3154940 RepID=UPI00342211E3
MDERYWSAVRTLRLRLADFLDTLTAAEWNAPSLCQGWRVRDVAGHLAIIPTLTTWQLLTVAPRAGFNPNKINTLIAVRSGSREPAVVVSQIRAHADATRTARVLDTRDCLFDVIVHAQDIALPLGREFPIPAEDLGPALRRVWSMGWPFHAQRKLTGVTLTATDIEWAQGRGPKVAGPALALLLLLTGRFESALPSLDGPGIMMIQQPAAAGS